MLVPTRVIASTTPTRDDGGRSVDRRDTDLGRTPRLARAPRSRERPRDALAQRRPVWTSAGWLAPVDLPADAIVVLEQKERAGEPERGERPLCECECPQRREHVFAP